MPATIRIIHATDFIKATAEGELDLTESARILAEIVWATDLKDYEVILDTRHAHSSMSVTNLWYLASEINKVGGKLPRKTAVLCPRERFDHAAFFALCAQNRGFSVRAFTCYEDAMEWLIADASSPAMAAGQIAPTVHGGEHP
jgi:hypothetical protein